MLGSVECDVDNVGSFPSAGQQHDFDDSSPQKNSGNSSKLVPPSKLLQTWQRQGRVRSI